MQAREIREKFFAFFKEKGHSLLPSASLVPQNDASLLFINSGVAALKPYFEGRAKPPNPRIVGAQKCVRTNDIENVGYTARHHTFFEMLGNFSIGDYFKKEAIHWAWEFLTSKEWLGLDAAFLYVTIHTEDDEAYQVWAQEIGLSADRIKRLESNFWDLGAGPCGPNSEIFYDRIGGDGPFDPEGADERFLEIWNLVFSESNHNIDGTYTPLPQKNIDTGMGLERVASVMQNVATNYETDLFSSMIAEVERHSGLKEVGVAGKVIADHMRAITIMAADGILPSNEGRGYVMRRLLRRAMRYGRKVGLVDPFLYSLVKVTVPSLGTVYGDLVNQAGRIEELVLEEEERFLERLKTGEQLLEGLIIKAQVEQSKVLPGEDAFALYDTYGFPFDLTEEIVRERGFTVDREAFEREMQQQRSRARAGRAKVAGMNVQQKELLELKLNTSFEGYTKLVSKSKVVALLVEGRLVEQVECGQEALLVLESTPFYAESGGQVADQGKLNTAAAKLKLLNVTKGPGGEHLHQLLVEEGVLAVGDLVMAEVAEELRRQVACAHTATHLVHEALRRELGDHVQQAGSLVKPNYLRFDFTHGKALTEKQLAEIEKEVNKYIWFNLPISITEESLAAAEKRGARALFGEKYGEFVRVVKIGEYSLELCGGTHVANTGELGIFKFTKEASIGSGVRRIEGFVREKAYLYSRDQQKMLSQIALQLKVPVEKIEQAIEALKIKLKEQVAEQDILRLQLQQFLINEAPAQVKKINGSSLLVKRIDGYSMADLKSLATVLKGKTGEGLVLLFGSYLGRAQLVLAVSSYLVQKGLLANALIRPLAEFCGGKGGGRDILAQASGPNVSGLKHLPEKFLGIIEQEL
jgi:alanyl-tRNA synthetase